MPTGKYTSSGILISGAKMYTSNGEVRDQSVINNFIIRQDLKSLFKVAQTAELEPGLVNISLEPGKAIVNFPGQPMTMEMSYKRITYGRYLLNWVGTTLWSLPNNPSRCMQMADSILLYPVNKLNMQPVPTSGGYTMLYTPSLDYVLNVKPGALTVPFLSYAFFSNTPPYSACSWANGDTWNMFNPECIKRLQTGDTLVVQSKTVLLKKQ